MPTTPKCIEVSAQVSFGATVEVVKFEYVPKVFIGLSRKYEIPDDWTEQDARDFQSATAQDLRDEIEPLVQGEIDQFMELRDRIAEGG